jgi:MoaA/NifB/PqqE/SkfB family radical SAM enzyme
VIRIANWLLTRKCNLNCEYCAIVQNYEKKPRKYPDMKHYYKNEMKTEYVLKGLYKLKQHNPDMFHIFYGGEPLLRKDLYEIINFCNDHKIHYTIISNNTEEIRPHIKNLIDKVNDRIEGFTASVDPVFHDEKESGEDRVRKSVLGLENLINMKVYVRDVVAEITAMKHNYIHLYDLLKELSKYEINGDVTFIDIAKTPFYDFSNITDENLLVHQTAQLADQFEKIMKDNSLDVHMKEILIPAMWDCLPSNMDCEIDQSLHNISIDADGTIRLCLRIRGIYTPSLINLDNLLTSDGDINMAAHAAIKKDKRELCLKCNHTCQLMSKYIEETNAGPEDLVHLDKREDKTNG